MDVSRHGTSSNQRNGGRIVKVCGVVFGLVLLALVLTAPAALAYPEVDPFSTPVDPNVPTQVDSDIAVKGQTVESTGQGVAGLAFTGGDVIGMVVIGGVLVGGGALMVRASRRRVSPAAG